MRADAFRDLVHPLYHLDGIGRPAGHGDDDLLRSGGVRGLYGRYHRRACREPVVRDDDGPAFQRHLGLHYPVEVEPLAHGVQAGVLLLFYVALFYVEVSKGEAVDVDLPLLGDGADGELRVVRGAELPREYHVEFRLERERDLGGNDDPAPGEPYYYRVLSRVLFQPFVKRPPSLSSVCVS